MEKVNTNNKHYIEERAGEIIWKFNCKYVSTVALIETRLGVDKVKPKVWFKSEQLTRTLQVLDIFTRHHSKTDHHSAHI